MRLRVVSMSELRLEVLLEPERTGQSVAEVCRPRGISRETFYAYKRRYELEGAAGLEPRSRQPTRSPAQIDVDLEVKICELRKDHPRWGARRIRAELRKTGVEISGEELDGLGLHDHGAAAQLFLSVKTIEFHLKNAYRKLDVSNRTQLAGVLAADGIAPLEPVAKDP